LRKAITIKPSRTKDDAISFLHPNIQRKLEKMKNVLKLIKRKKVVTRSELQKILGTQETDTRYVLSNLVDRGILTRKKCPCGQGYLYSLSKQKE